MLGLFHCHYFVEWILTTAAVKGKMEQTIGENDSQNAL